LQGKTRISEISKISLMRDYVRMSNLYSHIDTTDEDGQYVSVHVVCTKYSNGYNKLHHQ
jgi:hypothetical protein